MNSKPKHKLFMNMDKSLHDAIKRVAEIENRSVSAQIHTMLNEGLELRKVKGETK